MFSDCLLHNFLPNAKLYDRALSLFGKNITSLQTLRNCLLLNINKTFTIQTRT